MTVTRTAAHPATDPAVRTATHPATGPATDPATAAPETSARRGHRTERDLLGTVEVPDDRYWGVHTGRALVNFPVSATAVGDCPLSSGHWQCSRKPPPSSTPVTDWSNPRSGTPSSPRAESCAAVPSTTVCVSSSR